MDEKKAYLILGLARPATRDQAKKAYRSLAKKYHPDKSNSPNGDPAFSESKMAQINLAFRFLTPRLPDAPQIKPDFQKIQPQKPPRKSRLTSSVSNGFWVFVKAWIAKLKRTAKGAGAFKTNTSPSSGSTAKQHSKNDIRFDDVLKTAKPGAFSAARTRRAAPAARKRRHTAVYKRYQDYLKVNRQLRKTHAKRSKSSRIEPIGKVEPVSPVTPVTRDDI